MEKYRLVIVNERGYSLICNLECSKEDKDVVVETLRKASEIVVVRADEVR